MAKNAVMPLTDRQRADFDRLVHSKPVVLFMKGNRRFPQCGFSATVVGILDKLGAEVRNGEHPRGSRRFATG